MKKEVEGGGYSIGSGDTLVGVMVEYLEKGKSIEESLAAGVSCGLFFLSWGFSMRKS